MTYKLERSVELLNEKGVDYRIIGSHAVHLYGVEHESRNDIDIIIPRADIRSIPEIRKKLHHDFGRLAVLGTYPSIKTVNFTSEHTRLEHGSLAVDLDDSTMEEVDIDGIKTIPPESLYGLYGTIGIDRQKDAVDKEYLNSIAENDPDPAFEQFKRLRNERYPLYTPIRAMKETLIKPIPKNIQLIVQDAIEKRVESRYDG